MVWLHRLVATLAASLAPHITQGCAPTAVAPQSACDTPARSPSRASKRIARSLRRADLAAEDPLHATNPGCSPEGFGSDSRRSWGALLSFGAALGLLAATVTGAPEAANAAGGFDWNYYFINKWKKKYKVCDGKSQSPIDIQAPVMSQSKESLAKRMNYKPLGDREVLNGGRGVQINGGFGELTLPNGVYEVKQFHFHVPAEHEVGGKLGAAEMHIVHQKKGASGVKDLAVVGIIFDDEYDKQKEPVETMDMFISLKEKKAREKKKQESIQAKLAFLEQLGWGKELPVDGDFVELDKKVDITVFKEEYESPFWHYYGSLTTPPCAETVHWYVLSKYAPITKQMVKSWKERFPNYGTNRPVQGLNGRKLVQDAVKVENEF